MHPIRSGNNSFSPKQVRNVFIIKDDPLQLQLLKDYLKMKYQLVPHGFTHGEVALQELALNPDLVLLDYELARDGSNAANGLEILKKIKKNHPGVHVVMLSNHDKVDISVACIKRSIIS